MVILVHNRFLRQLRDRKMPPNVMKNILKRLRELSKTREDAAALSDYLSRNGVDWRRFHGGRAGKLKLSAGDRLVCAWTRDLGWRESGDFVLLVWQDHDHQELFSESILEQDCVPLSSVMDWFY